MAAPHTYTDIHDLASLTQEESTSFQSLPVLTIGRVQSVDAASAELRLECADSCKNPCTIVVDIHLMEPMSLIRGTRLKVFGETALTEDKNVLLRAKIIKVVNEIDVKRFNHAHQVRLEYLNERTLCKST